MDFSYTAKEEAFRQDLRIWLENNLPAGWLEGNRTLPVDPEEQKRFLKEWQQKLFEGGWSGVSWPIEYGGRGATLIEEVIYEQEMARVSAPPIINIVGINMIGPTLLQIGTEEQKKQYIHTILSGEEIWCQGYSEPNSGSDLASLQTRAEKQGDQWILNGQKIWTSYAHFADRCFVLARTDNTGKKHQGITAFLVNMHQEGVEVKPIRSINDKCDFNEVFFNDAVAYDVEVVGEVNRGWKVALALLSFERVGVGRQIFQLQQLFEELLEMTKTIKKNGELLIKNPSIRQKIAMFRTKSKALLLNYYRHLTQIIQSNKPGALGSMDKIEVSELGKEMYKFAMSIQGASSILWKKDAPIDDKWQQGFLRSRAYSIEGGTSEIQKNIVAEQILGLPKDIKF